MFKSLARQLRIRNASLSATRQLAAEGRVAFVVSAPRSGSTWLERSLNGHSKVYATENRFFGEFCERWPEDDGETTFPRITADAYFSAWAKPLDKTALLSGEAFMRELALQRHLANTLKLERLLSGRSFIVDKITPYHGTAEMVLKRIRKYFPNAKLIHLHRDGRDVATSGVFDWILKKDSGSARHRRYALNQDCHLDRFFDDDDLENWSRYWIEPILAWGSTGISPDLTITYDQMKSDVTAVLERIFRLLGLSADAATLRRCTEAGSFQKLSGGRKAGQELATAKTRKGISGDWKNYFTRADGIKFQRLTNRLLHQLGYEHNENWYSELPDRIRPQKTQSR